jgi:hypothetical protein
MNTKYIMQQILDSLFASPGIKYECIPIPLCAILQDEGAMREFGFVLYTLDRLCKAVESHAKETGEWLRSVPQLKSSFFVSHFGCHVMCTELLAPAA